MSCWATEFVQKFGDETFGTEVWAGQRQCIAKRPDDFHTSFGRCGHGPAGGLQDLTVPNQSDCDQGLGVSAQEGVACGPLAARRLAYAPWQAGTCRARAFLFVENRQ